MKNLFKKLLKINYTFKIPNKKKVLVYDNNSVTILSKFFSENYNILKTRFEEISIPIMLWSLFIYYKDTIKLKNIYFNYLKTFIFISNPKVIITFIDNDINFYKFKFHFKNIKFIAIQNGYRFFKNDLFQSLDSSSENFVLDEYYCFGEYIKKKLSNKIKSKIISVGSIKNNYCKKTVKKDKNLCFISSFGVSNLKFEKNIIKYLESFCEKKNINLSILARTNNKKEKDFYNSIINTEYSIYLEKSENFCNSYDIIDGASLSISLNATLGYESLARGNKTFFLNVNDRDLDCKSFLQFGYPENLPAEGYFWTNKLIKDEFLNKIEEIYKATEADWDKKTRYIVNNIINFDPENNILKSHLQNYLN